MEDNKRKEYSSFQLLLTFLGIVSTVLVYSPNSTLANIFTYVMYISWVGLAILLIFNGNGNGINYMVVWMGVIYLAYVLMGKLAYASHSYGPGIGGNLTKCMLFYFIGYNFKGFPRKKITLAYGIACTILAINLYLVILQNGWEMKDKNQFGFMLAMAIVSEYLFLLKERGGFIERLLVFGMLIFTTFVCIQLHSRTPIIALVFAGLVRFFSQRRSFRDYAIFIIVLIGVIAYLNTSVGSEFLHSFLQGDGRTKTLTVNSMTSGRMNLFKEAIEDFVENPIFGVGAWAFVDSMPLCVLRTSGIVGALLIFPLGYGRTILTVKELNSNYEYKFDAFFRMFVMLTLMALFASLTEGGLPFGPGTQMFYYWILFGHVDASVLASKSADSENA